MANGIHGLLCLALLDKTDDGIGNDHGQNDSGINPMPKQRRNQGAPEQHINQDIVKVQ